MNTIINQSILNQNNSLNHGSHKAIPSWIVWVQCSCFAVLYSIWYYPQTNFLSDLCMVIGAVLSLYVLFLNRSFFSAKESIPFWMLVALFGWIIFHLLFLSNNYPLQLREFTNIWKRAALAIIFALGFGIALANSVSKKGYWVIFYLGMMMPTVIYLVKYILNIYAPSYGFSVPEYLQIGLTENSIFRIHKVYVSFFSLPALAISLAQLRRNLLEEHIFIWSNGIFILGIITVLIILVLENSKNGIAHSFILILFFIGLSIYDLLNKAKIKNSSSFRLKILIILILFSFAIFFLVVHVDRNLAWKSFWVDSMVAINVDQVDAWKYGSAIQFYPLNKYGNHVVNTNYERLAWLIIGFRLLNDKPLGFGLVENSFGYLAKMHWPESLLNQSHSGWLDLALGIGVPGFTLLLSVILFAMFSLTKMDKKYSSHERVRWTSGVFFVLGSLLLLWCTSEISIKIPLIATLFWASFSIGLLWRKNISFL